MSNRLSHPPAHCLPHPLLLIDLASDTNENTNLADQHPEVVARLLALADSARQDLGELDRPGRRQRPPGFVSNPVALHPATEAP